jgi:hypothetical protein
MSDLRAAAQQALKAFRKCVPMDGKHAEVDAVFKSLRAALEQEEQEPVGWLESPHGAFRANLLYRMTAPQSVAWSIPLYAHLPRREWQGLTDEEIKNAVLGDLFGGSALMSMMRDGVMVAELRQAIERIARAIEDALRRKNT